MKEFAEDFRHSVIKFILSVKHFRMSKELRRNIRNYRAYYMLEHDYRKFLLSVPATPPDRPSEKSKYPDRVWWLWLQGEESAPPICKACLASVRRYFPDKKIVVLSEQNLWDYVTFPDYIKEKYKRGHIKRPHFSDLVRTNLIVNYGGIWADSTVYFTGRPDFALGIPLFVFNNSRRGDASSCLSSWFISAEKGDPILSLTQDLLFDYWKKHNRLCHYYMFHLFFTMAAKKYSAEWNDVPIFPNLPPLTMEKEMFKPFSEKRFEQLKSMTPVHKLTHRFDKSMDLSGTLLGHIIQSENSTA